MGNPFFVSRLAAFTIALLLLAESVEPGWGINGSWAWYLALFVLTLMTSWNLVSFVACVLSLLLLVGVVDGGRAAYIALTIFTGVALLRPLRGISTFAWWNWSSAAGELRPPRSARWRRWRHQRMHW